MEEPPHIDRISSSRGVCLSDAAKIVGGYLSRIDMYHRRDARPLADEDDVENPTALNDNDEEAQWKSRREREKEALLAQIDRLANDKSSSGMISDDVYERLKMISESMCADVEGRPYSASGVVAASRGASGELAEGEEDEEENDGEGDFLPPIFPAEWEEEEQLEQTEEQQQRKSDASKRVKTKEKEARQSLDSKSTKRDKKKEKKAKKAAKKAKKEAKRKAKEMEGEKGSTRARKRTKRD